MGSLFADAAEPALGLASETALQKVLQTYGSENSRGAGSDNRDEDGDFNGYK